MSASNVKGWCPSSLRPMMSGDGLVVRVKPPFGRMTSAQMRGFCEIAKRFGNGIAELTNRANLQIRGVDEAQHAELIGALVDRGLASLDPMIDRAAILVSPNCDDSDKVVYQALQKVNLEGTSAKFGLALERYDAPLLSDYSADIRIFLEGDRVLVAADGAARGTWVACGDVLALVHVFVTWFLAHKATSRRMRDVVHAHDLPPDLANAPVPIGRPALKFGATEGGHSIGIPFGQFQADDMIAYLAHCPEPTIRLAPWRAMILDVTAPLVDSPFISHDNDPLAQVSACSGKPFCTAAHIETHILARRLAPHALKGVHVSGCGKGCAYSKPAPITVVGTPDGLDLIFDGCTWDEPALTGLSETDLLRQVTR